MTRGRLTDKEKQQIRELTLAGVRQSDISRRLKIHRGTVCRAQRRCNLPTRIGIPEEQIRKLHQEGKSQKQIAALLGRPRGLVYRWQKKLGLTAKRHGPRSPELDATQKVEVLARLKRGDSWKSICDELKVRDSAVRRIAKENGIRRIHQWDLISPVTQAQIMEEIRERRNFGLDLARKYGVSYKLILRVAHRELACPKFRSGYGEPLSSHFPLRHHKKRVNAT
jgi:transposase